MRGIGWTPFSLILVLILCSSVFASLTINEIMYDPGQCSDTYCEWVELYNPGNASVNLTSCLLDGKNLSGAVNPYDYLIVARNIQNFTAYFGSVNNLIQSSFSLTNSGDTLVLNGTAECQESVDYTPFIDLAAGNNKTLEKDGEGNWRESRFAGGTPGRENSVANISSDYSFLAISEILANPFENDNALKPDGEWVEIFNYGPEEIYAGGLFLIDKDSENELEIAQANVMNEDELFVPPGGYIVVYRDGDSDFALNNNGEEEVRLFTPDGQLIDFMSYSETTEGMSWSNIEGTWYLTSPTPGGDNEYTGECIWFLYIDMNNSIFQPEDFSFSIMVSRAAGLVDNVTVRGAIEDAQGNTVTKYAPWTNETVVSDRSKTYSPNLTEGFYQASFWFELTPCLDVDPNDYRVTRAFAISRTYQRADSQLSINKVDLGSDNKVPWGGQFTVELEVYKGNNTATSLTVWAEKAGKVISKKTSLNVERQYQFYPLTVPVQLLPNCDQELADGTATLVVEGLDRRVEKEITVEGLDKTVCKKYTAQLKKELKKMEQQQKKENKTVTRSRQFFLEELPASISAGEVLRLQVHLLNDDKKKHDYQLWSYLFRGNKCYSCQQNTLSREENLLKVRLPPGESKTVDFLLKVDDDLKEGEYKVKVKLRKDEQKTLKELTSSIYVLEEEDSAAPSIKTERKETTLSSLSTDEGDQAKALLAEKKKIADGLTGFVVYESSSEKAQHLTPYLLLTAVGLIIVILLFQKSNT